MSSPPRVSVITPTFNRLAYLAQAIESVLGQTFKAWELIVVDDGSQDDTAQVVRALADPRIRYVYQANAGRSAARNRGLGLARGDFIALLDDDDLYLSGKLASQVRFLEEHPDVDLVAAGTRIVDEDGNLLRTWRCWEDQPELTLQACLDACPLPPCTVLFRHRVLDNMAQWFDTQMEPAEDTDFFLRLLIAGCRMAWLPEIVSAYRRHSGSSQWDGARYSQRYHRMLDKLFAEPALPASVQADRERLYAHYHMAGALHAYATGQMEAAQADLAQALTSQPHWGEGRQPPFAGYVAGFAVNDMVADPITYIYFVYGNLPTAWKHLRRYRRHTVSLLYMQAIFKGNNDFELMDWLRGVYNDPDWLRNRGVWSLLAKRIQRSIGIG